MTFPYGFPDHLKPLATAYVLRARKEFPWPEHLKLAIKSAFFNIADSVCKAVENRELTPHLALSGLTEIIHILYAELSGQALVYNVLAYEQLELDVTKEITESEEWLECVERIAGLKGAKKDEETSQPVTLSESRKLLVLPLLDAKGWPILDWAHESRLDYHTVNDYLQGRTKPYRSTRKKMADSLGIPVERLP